MCYGGDDDYDICYGGCGGDYNDIKFIVVLVMVMMIIILNLLWLS
jgi:hypothetical protein